MKRKYSYTYYSKRFCVNNIVQCWNMTCDVGAFLVKATFYSDGTIHQVFLHIEEERKIH